LPISDNYIVQYLVDGTLEVPTQIHWCEKDTDQIGYVATMEEVEVILEPFYSSGGCSLCLRFRHRDEEFSIREPAAGGWLGRKLSTEDERELSRLFRKLNAAVTSQCSVRRHRTGQNQEEIRDRIGRRLLFGVTIAQPR